MNTGKETWFEEALAMAVHWLMGDSGKDSLAIISAGKKKGTHFIVLQVSGAVTFMFLT